MNTFPDRGLLYIALHRQALFRVFTKDFTFQVFREEIAGPDFRFPVFTKHSVSNSFSCIFVIWPEMHIPHPIRPWQRTQRGQ